jgi:hypothetical protein
LILGRQSTYPYSQRFPQAARLLQDHPNHLRQMHVVLMIEVGHTHSEQPPMTVMLVI